jgi:hypothetical protein
MDRDWLRQQLAHKEEHIALSRRHLLDQRALLARLERAGRRQEAATAKELLTLLEKALELDLWDRDRLKALSAAYGE